jgi:hypothetical protein
MTNARILLMRHAEKTGDPKDPHLSQEGYARAANLAVYIPATFGVPQFLIATGLPPEKWSSLMYGLWPDGGLKNAKEATHG